MMMGFGVGGPGLVAMILFWVLLIALAVWLLGRLFPQAVDFPSGGRERSSAEEILKERYARGEIGKAQFDEMRQALRE